MRVVSLSLLSPLSTACSPACSPCSVDYVAVWECQAKCSLGIRLCWYTGQDWALSIIFLSLILAGNKRSLIRSDLCVTQYRWWDLLLINTLTHATGSMTAGCSNASLFPTWALHTPLTYTMYLHIFIILSTCILFTTSSYSLSATFACNCSVNILAVCCFHLCSMQFFTSSKIVTIFHL